MGVLVAMITVQIGKHLAINDKATGMIVGVKIIVSMGRTMIVEMKGETKAITVDVMAEMQVQKLDETEMLVTIKDAIMPLI